MGLGHYLTEEVVHDPTNARLLTRGTWSVTDHSHTHTRSINCKHEKHGPISMRV